MLIGVPRLNSKHGGGEGNETMRLGREATDVDQSTKYIPTGPYPGRYMELALGGFWGKHQRSGPDLARPAACLHALYFRPHPLSLVLT